MNKAAAFLIEQGAIDEIDYEVLVIRCRLAVFEIGIWYRRFKGPVNQFKNPWGRESWAYLVRGVAYPFLLTNEFLSRSL